MAFQLSPGVLVTEKDLTNVVPAVSSSAAAFCGDFVWGPVEQVQLIGSENQLVRQFGGPASYNTTDWFSAANFLGYGNNLQVVRACGTSALNATSAGDGILIKNEDIYLTTNASGSNDQGAFAAKYPGIFGNSIVVAIADSGTFKDIAGTGTITTATNSKTVTGSGTSFLTETHVGAILKDDAGNTIGEVLYIASDTSLSLVANAQVATSADDFLIDWAYASQFDGAPGTSTWASNNNATNDEVHVIVVDKNGLFTGVRGTVLEKFPFLSKGNTAKNADGSTNYYKNVVNAQSSYVWWLDHPTAATTTDNWGTLVAGTSYGVLNYAVVDHLSGGAIDAPTDAELITGYNLFQNKELYDVSLIITGGHSATVVNNAIDNIALSRLDCVVFLSPPLTSVQNNAADAAVDVVAYRQNDINRATSYAVMDSGWKVQYDRYNDAYINVPLNADTAGLCARTDTTNDAWWSPAGYNRGQIKNVVKLLWSPNQTERDELYKNGVNPVTTFPGQGTILYGDKTLLAKPSAFDRINVRRLFIVLEKAIATAAKYQLFEFNDVFTRSQFRSMVEPFLRDVRGRRGIYDFRVVCDESNNTGEVIDRNEFVADIYIKPAKSINFIYLNFVATRTSVAFEEVGA
jgi:phage tail sheath protein FI